MSYKITDTVVVDQNKNLSSIGIATFAGPLLIGGGSSTGTVSQSLQVLGTNGAYIGGNLGVGSTNPSSKLSVIGSATFIGDATFSGIITSSVLNVRKDPGTGIATDFTNSVFGNGWRLSAPASTTYYRLATLPVGSGGNTFDHLKIEGTLGAWTNDNQTPFEIIFSNRGSFDYKYISYGSIRSDVRIIGISTNSTVEIWAQHQASAFTKLVYNISESIQAIVVSNPTSTTTAPVGTTVFDSSTTQPRFIINESDNVGIGTTSIPDRLTVLGRIQIQQDSGSNNRFVLRGQPGSLYRWNIDNFGSSNEFRIFREDDVTAANGSVAVSISTTGTLTATRFSGDGSGLTGISAGLSSITISNNVANSNQLIPYVVSTGNTTGLGVTSLFVYNPSSRNLGIGTTNPQYRTHIVGTDDILAVESTNTTARSTLKFITNGNDWEVGARGSASSPADAFYIFSNDYNTYAQVIDRFGNVLLGGSTTSTGTDSQPLQVTGGAYVSGSVGIGTTNPSSRLSVIGNVLISGITTANSFRARGGAPGALGVNNNGYGFFGSGDNDSGMYSSADGQIEFYSNSAEVARIDANQRIGIGTTNPSQKLHVQGNARITGSIYDSTNSTGNSGQVLQSTVSGTQWVDAAPAAAITGLTIREEGTILGTANSVSQLNFVGSNVTVTASGSISTITVSDNLVGTSLSISGISTLGVTSTTNLTVQQLNVSGVVTATSFIGSGASLTSLNASQLTSGTVPTARITGASGDFTVGQNLFVNGNVSIGGTTTLIYAQQLRIADKDITLGVTTAPNGDDISTDITANHGGISIASTTGTPLIGIPTDAVNNDRSTYKQIMWVRQNHYSGFGTDAWVFNYGVSIGNTATVQNLSRLTVGAGFTVYDNYIDVQDIRNRNINSVGVGTIATLNSTVLTATNASGTNLNYTGVSTISTLNVGTGGTIITTTSTGLVGIGTINPTAKIQVVPTSTGVAGLFSGTTSSDMVRITQTGSGNALVVEDETNPDSTPFVVTAIGRVGIGTTNPTYKLDVGGDINTTYINSTGGGRIYEQLYLDLQNSADPEALAINGGSTGASFKWMSPSGNIFVGHRKKIFGGTSYDYTISTPATLGFGVVTGGRTNYDFYINSSGNLGIGTTNPAQKLEVSGEARIANRDSYFSAPGDLFSFPGLENDIKYPASSYEITEVQCVADVAGSLNNKYFTIYGPGGTSSTIDTTLTEQLVVVWFNVAGAGTTPSVVGAGRSVGISITTGASAVSIASSIATTFSSDAAFTVGDSGIGTVYFVANAPNNFTDSNAGTSGFAVTTTSNGSGSLSGFLKWAGGVLAPNGKIYGIPYSSTSVLVIDPAVGTATTFGSFSGNAAKWIGGVLAPNGKIYGIPFDSTSILAIDPAVGTATTFGSLSGNSKWAGGVLAPNGKIYGIPASSTSVLVIDPVVGTATTFGSLSGTLKWYGGVLAPNGKIYGIPYNSTSVLVIDPVVGTATTFGSLSGAFKWAGGVLAPNGKIYGIPASSTSVLVIDPVVGTATTFGSLSGSNKWVGGVLAPNGKIYGIPLGSTSVLVIDPATNTTSTFGSLSGSNKWIGGVLAPNGKIYGIPCNSTSVLSIGGGSAAIPNWYLSAYQNKF